MIKKLASSNVNFKDNCSEHKDFVLNTAELLIDELIKDQPDQKLVKNLMSKIGMKYSANGIDQMSQILTFLSDFKAKKTKNGIQKDIGL